MNITVTGTIQRVNMGPGTWALKSDEGKTYEIYQGAPSELLQIGQKVKIFGRVRDDVMTMAMIGPVLEVRVFEVAK
jgi:hypothetical protein